MPTLLCMIEPIQKTPWYKNRNYHLAIAVLAAIIFLCLYIYAIRKQKPDSTLNQGVQKIIDSIVSVNTLKLYQQQQEFKRAVDSAIKVANSKDSRIIKEIFYRDKEHQRIDTATDAVLQGLFDERYAP